MCTYLQFDSTTRKDAFLSSINVNSILEPARLATDAVLPDAPVYTSGEQTLTQTGAPAVLTVDGTAAAVGDRILVKDQADPRENGVYVLVSNTPWQLVRDGNFSQRVMPFQRAGVALAVTDGVANIGTAWATTVALTKIDPPTDAVLFGALTWTPNDAKSTPASYKVEYRNFNRFVDLVTKEWREHCRRTPDVLSFYVDSCVVSVPGGAYINRPNADGTTSRVYLTEEPYIYVELHPEETSEGNRFTTNNEHGFKATFIVYTDKFIVGTNDTPPAAPAYTPPTLNSGLKWFHFKSCMRVNMRMTIKSALWTVRMFDRFGNDIVIVEDPAAMPPAVTPTMPPVNPAKQTSILLGLTPEYVAYRFDSANADGVCR